MDESADLLRAYAETGSEPAFRLLVERHVGLVFGTALRRVGGDAHLAQDIVQTVFTDLAVGMRRPGKLRAEDIRCLAAWLHRHTCLKAAETLRSERRRALREHAVAMTAPEALEPAPDWRDLAPVLDDALGELSADDRQAVLLRFFEHLDWRSIGQSLGLGDDAVQKRVARALEKLRVQLQRRGIRSTAAALAAVLTTHAATAAPVGLAATAAGAALASTAGLATVAAPIGLLAETLALLMHAKKWTALAALVLLGAATTPLWLHRTPPPPVVVQFTTPAPTNSAAPPAADSGFRWADIESEDYRQFIANLRASGAPEKLIRDVVGLELHREWAARSRAIRGTRTPGPYWKKSTVQELTEDQRKQLVASGQILEASLDSLLGTGFTLQDTINLVHLQTDPFGHKLAWLPPEVEAPARTALAQVEAGRDPSRGYSSADQTLWLEQEIQALKPILNTEQLEEYRKRNDSNISVKRSMVSHWQPSREEFEAYLSAMSANERSLTVDSLVWSRAEEAQRTAVVTQLFGAERGEAFIRTTDITYQNAHDVIRRLELPADVPDQLYRIKRAALERDDTLRTSSGLTPEAIQTERVKIRQWAEEQFTALVGKTGTSALQQSDWPWWRQLKQP
jgi:RNA polymerase sigma factor (sigma-70 family)